MIFLVYFRRLVKRATFAAESMEIENSSGNFAVSKKTPVIISLKSLNEDLSVKTREENNSSANVQSR